MTNYYSVTLKFGHVGRHSYIVKSVPIAAENGKEAAYRARWMGRAKHHEKYAILETVKITKEEYDAMMIEKKNDPYFNVKSKQEQDLFCEGIEDEICYYSDDIDYEERRKNRQDRVTYMQKKHKDLSKDYLYAIRNYDTAYAY